MRRLTFTDGIVVAFLLWFGSYAYLYSYAFSGFKPLYSYFLLLGFAALWIARQGRLRALEDSGMRMLLAWLALYLMYSGCFGFLYSTQDPVALQVFITLGEAVLLTGAFALLFAQPSRLGRIQAGFAMLALLASVINGYDFLHPLFTKVPGRAAGLYVNPNIAGHFIAMAMVAGCSAVPRRLRLWFVLACGAGVLLTFSRAAWILWGLGSVWLGWMGEVGPARRRLVGATLAGVIGLGFIGLVFTGGLGDMLNQSVFASHLDANTLARLGVGSSSLSGHSAHLREKVFWGSLRLGAHAPLFGHGLGYTNEWRFPVGPHDMYMLFLVEGGLLGLLLYAALMVLLWRKSSGVGRIVALQLIIAGVFTHNQMEQPAFLMMMAFVIAHHAVSRRRQSSLPARVSAMALV